MPARRRLATELVSRRLADDEAQALGLVDARRVTVNGAIADNINRLVAAADALTVVTPARFVGRGGDKLDHALDHFGVDVSGRRWLDAGASTGGFTDCLRQRGAAHVVALDVGHGQLHPRVRDDPAVTVIEHVHIRDADVATVGGLVDGVVADLSFISLRSVLRPLVALCQPGAQMVLLTKPQFEATRHEVHAGGGVISDPAVWTRVRDEVTAALTALRCDVVGWVDSPVTGARGNREFFVHATSPA